MPKKKERKPNISNGESMKTRHPIEVFCLIIWLIGILGLPIFAEDHPKVLTAMKKANTPFSQKNSKYLLGYPLYTKPENITFQRTSEFPTKFSLQMVVSKIKAAFKAPGHKFTHTDDIFFQDGASILFARNEPSEEQDWQFIDVVNFQVKIKDNFVSFIYLASRDTWLLNSEKVTEEKIGDLNAEVKGIIKEIARGL